jgi:hypothetical protein
MAYIGKQPIVGNFQVCDAISVVNGQAAYTMQVNSTNVTPETAFHMLVSLNGVLQKPGSSFTISGSTITFASNLATGDVIDFIILLGDVLNIGAPSDDTVTASSVNNDFISGQTALSATPDDTDEFLVSDAGTIKRIDYSLIKGGGITVADQFRVTTNITANADPVSSNIERIDTSGQGGITDSQMSVSSGVFTFPATGIYLVMANSGNVNVSGTDSVSLGINVTTDNSSFTSIAGANDGSVNVSASMSVQSLIDVTDVSNVKCSFSVGSIASGTQFECSTTSNGLTFTFIRLADT